MIPRATRIRSTPAKPVDNAAGSFSDTATSLAAPSREHPDGGPIQHAVPNSSMRLVGKIQPPSRPIFIRFSPDGNLLAIACERQVFIYNTTTSQLIDTIVDDMVIVGVSFAPPGRILTSNAMGAVAIWDIMPLVMRRRSLTSPDIEFADFARDGNIVLQYDENGNIHIWDVQEDIAINDWFVGVGVTMAISPNGAAVATFNQASEFRLWDAKTGTHKVCEDCPIIDRVHHISVVFSDDSNHVIVANGSSVIVWGVGISWISPYKQLLHTAAPASHLAAISTDSVIIGQANGRIVLWNWRTGLVSLTAQVNSSFLELIAATRWYCGPAAYQPRPEH
ncbi:hypothetical protein EDB81DRAFT_753779 [Dactylonectria macrodidyma]|uniref:Uncharacterized protein n=1 Tax=Dactylonectria macrodidyma TaxID=307937 RepID=A0A9P9JI17_9HYPO|nr:hypothetical protein EDB81DRAFT_753779 [Dactylonectria macrodidyma]